MTKHTADQELEQQVAFLKEIDELKSVIRKSPLINQSRRENSAEHSWHLAMYALILQQHAEPPINIDRVIKMLLIHDIVEVDAGDHPIHEAVDNSAQEALEQQAAERLFGLLPEAQGQELKALWQEFEAAQSHDALFAKSLDRFQPLIHNIATDGGTWIEAKLTQEQVEKRYISVISQGSQRLWAYTKELVAKHFNRQ